MISCLIKQRGKNDVFAFQLRGPASAHAGGLGVKGRAAPQPALVCTVGTSWAALEQRKPPRDTALSTSSSEPRIPSSLPFPLGFPSTTQHCLQLPPVRATPSASEELLTTAQQMRVVTQTHSPSETSPSQLEINSSSQAALY